MTGKKVNKSLSKCKLIIPGERNGLMPEENNNNDCSFSEIVFTAGIAIIIVILLTTLCLSMRGDWPLDEVTRTRVLVIAMILFWLNIFLCCYATKRMGFRFCRPEVEDNVLGFSRSPNAEDPLLQRDLPPSYDSVTITNENMTHPPSYDELSESFGVLHPDQEHPIAAGFDGKLITEENSPKIIRTVERFSEDTKKDNKKTECDTKNPEQEHHKATG